MRTLADWGPSKEKMQIIELQLNNQYMPISFKIIFQPFLVPGHLVNLAFPQLAISSTT
jgi:hypothetical protein